MTALCAAGPDAPALLAAGVDSLGHLEQYQRGEDPLSQVDRERWLELPSTAARR